MAVRIVTPHAIYKEINPRFATASELASVHFATLLERRYSKSIHESRR